MPTMLGDTINFFIYYILPYITFFVFVGGLSYRVVSWFSNPPLKASLSLFPKPNGLRTAFSLLSDETVFPRLARYNKSLWFFAILLHACIIPLLFGHLRLFQEPAWLWSLLRLSDEGVKMFAFYAGGITGIVFMIALAALFIRRVKGIMRTISVLEDYFILILLIAIAISGNYMRFAMHIDVSELQAYFTSLLAFNPRLTDVLFEPAFIAHYLLASAFFIYFPFSKLIHIIGSFITNYVVKR